MQIATLKGLQIRVWHHTLPYEDTLWVDAVDMPATRIVASQLEHLHTDATIIVRVDGTADPVEVHYRLTEDYWTE